MVDVLKHDALHSSWILSNASLNRCIFVQPLVTVEAWKHLFAATSGKQRLMMSASGVQRKDPTVGRPRVLGATVRAELDRMQLRPGFPTHSSSLQAWICVGSANHVSRETGTHGEKVHSTPGAEREAVAKGLLNKWRSTYMPHGDSACLEAVTFREAECYEVV
jgi:hypothetical protein